MRLEAKIPYENTRTNQSDTRSHMPNDVPPPVPPSPPGGKLSVASVHRWHGRPPRSPPAGGRFRHTRTVLKIDAKQERLARYHGDEMRRLVLFNLLIRVVQLLSGERKRAGGDM